MNDLTKKMLINSANMKRMLPDLSATQRMLNDFASIRGILPDQSTIQMIAGNFVTPQELFSDLRVAGTILDEVAIAKTLLPTQKILADFSAISRLLPDFNAMQKILADFSTAQKSLGGTASFLVKNLEAISLAHISLASLAWESIGGTININEELKTIIGGNFLSFSNSYLHLYQSFDQSSLNVTSFPSHIFELPTLEFFNGTDLLEAISAVGVEDQYVKAKQNMRHEVSIQVTDTLETLLADLDVNLVRLWQGAIQSLNSNNEDRSRHFLISLRELFTHVLHKLAPDSKVHSWTTSPEHFDKGNPTRKARLLFICRDINFDPFSAFVEKDITSVLSFWEVLNRAHEITIPFSQRQLTAFKIRMEGALRLLLVTWNSSK